MAKQSGLGDNLYIDQYNVSGDISALSDIATPRETLESTGIDKSAMERILSRRDGSVGFTSYFNDAALAEHAALKGLPRTDRVVSYFRGTALGGQAYSMVAKQIDYNPTRGDDGSLTFAVSAQANAYGADWGLALTSGQDTHASASSNTGVDFGTGSKSFGFQAYLHVFSLGSGTATVKIQESSDNGAGDAWADVTNGTFTNVTAGTSERIQSSSATLTVERYLRVTTTGTFTDLVFAVVVNRNDALRVI